MEGILTLLSDPNVKVAIMLSKMSIQILKKYFSKDVTEIMKKEIADSELHTAQNILDSIEFEAEHNWKHGIHRIMTHLESAFDLYVEKNEFQSACICGLYLSYMHKAVEDTHDELYKRIWIRVPIPSKNAITFEQYGSYIKTFISDFAYQDIVKQRKERYLKKLDDNIKSLSKSIAVCGVLSPAIKGLRISKEMLMKEKRELLGESDQRSISGKIFDLMKPTWMEWMD